MAVARCVSSPPASFGACGSRRGAAGDPCLIDVQRSVRATRGGQQIRRPRRRSARMPPRTKRSIRRSGPGCSRTDRGRAPPQGRGSTRRATPAQSARDADRRSHRARGALPCEGLPGWPRAVVRGAKRPDPYDGADSCRGHGDPPPRLPAASLFTMRGVRGRGSARLRAAPAPASLLDGPRALYACAPRNLAHAPYYRATSPTIPGLRCRLRARRRSSPTRWSEPVPPTLPKSSRVSWSSGTTRP